MMTEEDHSGNTSEASEPPRKISRRSREDDGAGKEASGSKSNKKAKSEVTIPKSFDDFNENKEGVTIQLVVKSAKGELIHVSDFEKKQFGSGSFGWTLNDRVTVDNGEGGKMAVSLNGNCVISGSKKNKNKS